MASINTINRDFGARICRRCINKTYHVNLLPKDCRYDGPYQQKCPNCHETHHIVDGFSLSGKMKLLLK